MSDEPHDEPNDADRPVRTELTRRAVLGVGAAGTGAVILAACGSGGGSDSANSGSGDAPSKNGVTLAKLSDVPVGGAVSATDSGKPVIVSQPNAGTAAAFSAKCTHLGCTVKPAGTELHCPCHGSRYDAATGKVLRGPAPKPLPKVAVHVANGSVVTGT